MSRSRIHNCTMEGGEKCAISIFPQENKGGYKFTEEIFIDFNITHMRLKDHFIRARNPQKAVEDFFYKIKKEIELCDKSLLVIINHPVKWANQSPTNSDFMVNIVKYLNEKIIYEHGTTFKSYEDECLQIANYICRKLKQEVEKLYIQD